MVLLTMWALVLLSLFHWQEAIFPYQQILQGLLALLILFFAYKTLNSAAKTLPFVITFNQQGEWSYLGKETAIQWQMTEKSRLTDWLLWIQLSSPIDTGQSHWVVVFKDQVSEADYRRLCRAILYQQQRKER